MAFKDIGGAFIDVDEIVAVQAIYGGNIELTLRGGGVIKVNSQGKLNDKPVLEGLVALLSTRPARHAA